MSALSIQPTFPTFTDSDGTALDDGYIWIGVAGSDPISTPLTAYWDAALTQVVTQPIRTRGGYPLNAGAIGRLYVNSNYSIKVRNRNGFDLYSSLTATERYNDVVVQVDASDVTYTPAGTGAVATTVQTKLRESVSVKDFGAVGNGVADDRAACQKAIDAVIAAGGGSVYFPAGIYLINSVASSDSSPNGLLIPDTNGVFSTDNGVRLYGDGVDSVIKAATTNMVVIRNSRFYTTIENLKVDGGPKTAVMGIGVIPESQTQTTELVSNSFFTMRDVHVENCTEGLKFQPGPTVLGADSGCFYHSIERCTFNLNTRHVWAVKDVTGAGNRITRSTFFKCIFLRGNTGVQFDGATEIDLVSCNWELISTGTSPNATPVAFFYNDTNPSFINLIGGYVEACTKAFVAVSGSEPYVSLIGCETSVVPDASQALMSVHVPGRLRVSKVGNNLAALDFGNNGFAALVADPDQVGAKTLAVKINGNDKERYNATGSKTFYGSIGNITMTAAGNEISFSRNGGNIISAQGGASAQMLYYGLAHTFANVAGVNFFSADSSYIYPITDNSMSCGLSGFRWSSVWSANGTIQTSDPRTKKDIVDSPLGLEFINALRPVAYKFKIGGNKIVGDREVKPAVLDENGDVLERAVMEALVEPQEGKRQHFGFLTTEVKTALGGVDFGGYVKVDPDDPDSEEALRYDQFIAPLVKAVQELAARVKALEEKA